MLGWCRADLQQHEPPAGPSCLLADVTNSFLANAGSGRAELGAGAEPGGRPQPPGRRKNSCSAPPSSRAPQIHPRNPEAADRCRPKDRRRRTTPGTGTEPPPARTRRAFSLISLTFRVGLYPLLGWCRADLQQHEPPAGPSCLLADVTDSFLANAGSGRAELGAGAEPGGRPQPPGRRKNSCSAPPSSRAPQIHPRNPEAADRCRPKDRRRRTTPGTGTEPPPARTRRAFSPISLTFRVGLYPLLGWCRADLQQHEPPAGPSCLLADVTDSFLANAGSGRAELGAGAEPGGRPQPPGRRKNSCSAPPSSRAPQIHPRNPEAADRCRPKDRRRRTTPGTGTEPPPARTRRAFSLISLTFRVGLYPLLGWCRADLQQHEPPAGPSCLLADVTDSFLANAGSGRAELGAGAEPGGRPQPPGRRKNSCSAPPSSRAPQIHPRNPEAADRCRPKDRRRRTTPGTGTEPPPARTRRAFSLISLTFRVGLYPLLGWCRADLQQHEPPAGPSCLLADVTDSFLANAGSGRAELGAGAEPGGRPQPPGRRKNSCSAPPSSRAPQIHPRNPEAADRCRPKDRRRRTTPGTGTEPPPARTRRAFSLISLTFRVGLYPLLGWCRADLQQHEPPAGPSCLLADVTDSFLANAGSGRAELGAGAEPGGRPQPPGRRKNSCSAPPSSRAPQIHPRNPEAADRCRPKDRRRRTTPGTGTEPPPARTRRAFSRSL